MPKSISSAQAYGKLSELTDQYETGQARLQELRALTRALRTLAVTYCTDERSGEPMFTAIVNMTEAASIERNRLYQEGSRLADEMNRINALIQNGAYNEKA